MKIQKALLSLVVVTAMPFAYAQESSTTTSDSSTIKKSETGATDLKDTDQEITNAKLRAESGSKKKWSFRSSFNYLGGNVQKPLSADRPNMTGSKIVSQDTAFEGLLGVKYRIGDRDSLSLRAGLSVRRPLGGPIFDQAREEVTKTELADPKLTWDHTTRAGDLQLISSTSVDYSTAREKVDQRMVSLLNFGQTMMYDFKNGLEMGVVADFNHNVYSGPIAVTATTVKNKQMTADGKDIREAYEIGLYPIIEYAFNDRYSFRTVFRYTTVTSTKDAPNTYAVRPGTQSIGVGIAVTRDFYMYPNLQFAPDNLRPEQTNWGLSTNINL